MAEAIHCPSCSTRYRLRPERLKASTRRAQCCICQGVFPVGDVVRRVLGAIPVEAATAAFMAEEVPAAQDVQPSDMTGPELEAPELEAPELEAFEPPSLTLGDLEGTEAEILEKTLVEAPAPATAALPEEKPESPLPSAPPSYPSEITESTLSGYTSARDAIDKLFSDSPSLAAEAKAPQNASNMDLEATLSALEETLGGSHPTPPAAPPDTPSGASAPSTLAMPPSTSTVRFTRDEVMAAMADGAVPVPAAGTPVPAEPSATDPTVTLQASDLAESAPRDQTQQMAAAQTLMTGPLPIPTPPAPATPEAELLRLKIGEEIYPGLTMTQLTQWVEEGRILEGHLVARQFSENWLEAHKGPGLRPVFDRLRRERLAALGASQGETFPPPPSETSPMKKSLFGGLFGGKN